MENPSSFKQEISRLIHEVGYLADFEIIDETANTLKIRLVINKVCFIQIYLNVKKNLKNYAVVLDGRRIYGMDKDGGRWHLHPWDDPDKHKLTKEILLRDFLFNVYDGLSEKGLL